MKKLIALFLAFCASVPALCAETVDADVVIYGGASAAVSAAPVTVTTARKAPAK